MTFMVRNITCEFTGSTTRSITALPRDRMLVHHRVTPRILSVLCNIKFS